MAAKESRRTSRPARTTGTRRRGARVAARDGRAREPVDGLGVLARELLGEADRLLADAPAVAGHAPAVAPVGEGRHVQEDGAEAQRDAQDEVEIVEDGEARVERPGRVERAAGEAHTLELSQVPAEDLGDAHRARGERARHARPDPRRLLAVRVAPWGQPAPALDHEGDLGIRAEEG